MPPGERILAGRAMRNREDIERALDDLVRRNYYSEDYELRWKIVHWVESLSHAEEEHYRQVALRRLIDDPSILSVLFCSAARIPEAVPVMVSLLNEKSETDMLTRAVFASLARYGQPSAFSAVERFLDSEQEIEALQCLAQLHFRRALFFVLRAAKRKHLRDACLHILHQRKKNAGMDGLIADLAEHAASTRRSVLRPVRHIVQCKQPPYHPFAEEEIERLLAGL
jgi:hypothetical protein